MNRLFVWPGCIALLCLLALGCDFKPTAVRKRPKVNLSDVVGAEQDDLNQGLDLLFRVNDPEPLGVERLGLFHFNQWLFKHEHEASDWKKEPLLEKIPSSLAKIQQLAELERLRFTAADFQFMQGRIFSRELVKWVTQRPLEEPLATWMKQQAGKHSAAEIEQLSAAIQIFDWVVRNIQLDPIPKREDATANESSELLAQRGDDGPGYRHFVRETIQLSHGDHLERMRVCIDLCRELAIEAVVVGISPEKAPFRPWAVGVLIGEQMYLFDPELGLPIPSANDTGVATVAELAQSPALLRQLDLDEKRPYPVTNEDLKSLEARISVTPEELSLRMARLQTQLIGERHIVLTYQPQSVLERLKKISQLSPVVSLWNVPFLSCLYSDFGRPIRLRKDHEYSLNHDQETIFFRPGSDPLYGRQLHLQGIFDKRDLYPGAVYLYMQSRPTEFSLDDIRLSPEFRKKVGLEEKLSANEAQRKQQLQIYLGRAERLRENVSYWMGLIQYERQDYENAVDWFKERSLAISPDNYWTRSLRYNLARSYEHLGRVDDAAKLYRLDSSAQRHGNLIRARRLSAVKEEGK